MVWVLPETKPHQNPSKDYIFPCSLGYEKVFNIAEETFFASLKRFLKYNYEQQMRSFYSDMEMTIINTPSLLIVQYKGPCAW